MQMDKRNQIGCEDTTKLSKEGVTFDLRPGNGAQTTTLTDGELVCPSVAGGELEGLSVPVRTAQE